MNSYSDLRQMPTQRQRVIKFIDRDGKPQERHSRGDLTLLLKSLRKHEATAVTVDGKAV